MFSRATIRLVPVLLISFALIGSACGGGGGSTEKAAGDEVDPAVAALPEPPPGQATIGGTVTVDGEPVSGENVTLGEAGSKDKTEIKTDADGAFVFEAVEPGSYWLATGVVVEEATPAAEDLLSGLAWDDPCSAAGFAVLNAPVSDGAPKGVVASASNEGGEGHTVAPFEVEADARLVKDIAFDCGTGG